MHPLTVFAHVTLVVPVLVPRANTKPIIVRTWRIVIVVQCFVAHVTIIPWCPRRDLNSRLSRSKREFLSAELLGQILVAPLGLEPRCSFERRILSAVRLPISSESQNLEARVGF